MSEAKKDECPSLRIPRSLLISRVYQESIRDGRRAAEARYGCLWQRLLPRTAGASAFRRYQILPDKGKMVIIYSKTVKNE